MAYRNTYSMTKEFRDLEPILNELPHGEFSRIVSEALIKYFPEVCKSRWERTKEKADKLKNAYEMSVRGEEERIKQQDDNKKWFDDQVNNFCESRGENGLTNVNLYAAEQWATGRRKDLRKRGFTSEDFVAAIERRLEELKTAQRDKI